MARAAGPSGGGPPHPSWRPDREARESRKAAGSLPCPALGRSEARLNVRPALTLSAQGPWGCQAWTAAPVSPHRVRGCRAGCRAQAAGGHCCTAVAAGAGAPPGSAEQTRTQSHGHHRRRTFIETMYRQATET